VSLVETDGLDEVAIISPTHHETSREITNQRRSGYGTNQ